MTLWCVATCLYRAIWGTNCSQIHNTDTRDRIFFEMRCFWKIGTSSPTVTGNLRNYLTKISRKKKKKILPYALFLNGIPILSSQAATFCAWSQRLVLILYTRSCWQKNKWSSPWIQRTNFLEQPLDIIPLNPFSHFHRLSA